MEADPIKDNDVNDSVVVDADDDVPDVPAEDVGGRVFGRSRSHQPCPHLSAVSAGPRIRLNCLAFLVHNQ